jgi:hypothetical protein
MANHHMPQSSANDRKWACVLCALAALRVFIFSAAFPFFNNVDEPFHFDLAVRYAQLQFPRGLTAISDEAIPFLVTFISPEYLSAPIRFPDGRIPPPLWHQPTAVVNTQLAVQRPKWRAVLNANASEPPLYYLLAGRWWRLGEWLGLHDGLLLYWLRFLNVFLISALVWLAFVAARLTFPDSRRLCLGVPALLAFFPQTVFYSIQSDILSPLCFGVALILLVSFWQRVVPGVGLGLGLGLALAATGLTKLTNLPLLAIASLVLPAKAWQLRNRQLRQGWTSLIALVLGAGLPLATWMIWCHRMYGDFTGSDRKIALMGWTKQPFAAWLHHPLFTPSGLSTFVSGLLATFWQGETTWYGKPLSLPSVNIICVGISLLLLGVAAAGLLLRAAGDSSRREILWFSFGCFLAPMMFLAFLSIRFDFGECIYPSRAHPFFTSGRLMLGALIPFLLVFVYGLDRTFGAVKSHWPRTLALAGLVSFLLISEIVADWPVFFSQYNWYHM